MLKQAFPEAKIVALPATVNAAKTGWPARQKFWFPTYGNNIPGPEPVLPEELATPVLTLEGEEFPITGGVQGADGPGNSFVWVPSLKAVITGDIVFDHVYFGVPRDEARENWLKTIDQIAALNPAIVIPGHEGPGATRDMRSIELMKKYIADWDANVAQSKTAAEMRANVLKQYPRPRHGVHAERPDRDVLPGAAGGRQVGGGQGRADVIVLCRLRLGRCLPAPREVVVEDLQPVGAHHWDRPGGARLHLQHLRRGVGERRPLRQPAAVGIAGLGKVGPVGPQQVRHRFVDGVAGGRLCSRSCRNTYGSSEACAEPKPARGESAA